MLDFTEASLKKVLTRYNVALEKEMTPEEVAVKSVKKPTEAKEPKDERAKKLLKPV